MGRAIKTYRSRLESELAAWKNFRRVLRKIDQEALDQLFYYARIHGDAGTMVPSFDVSITMILSMLLEIQKKINEFDKRFKELEKLLEVSK